jgi:hypothetical protein
MEKMKDEIYTSKVKMAELNEEIKKLQQAVRA